ncbi:uncharacterized protein C1orf198 homolog isoform X1 [Ambystoma mexicanum]|uniref:uncharacterized protein C1orf198 homolog isoform X1 n=1 Tax=Ambystoma mexicanum TaxID=8296 RepID=UPI0037E75EC5
MAFLAAAVSAARTASMCGNRPLDERERGRYYFCSLKPAARRVKLDKQRILEEYGYPWERTPRRQSERPAEELCAHGVRTTTTRPPGYTDGRRPLSSQEGAPCGQQDITWQDEHSAPFSWETRSQMEFSVASLTTQEESGFPVLPIDPKQPAKAVQGGPAPKGAHVTQPTKPSQGSKTPNMDGPAPARKEEESAFWKISAERSKIEGEEAEFHSLTPSQIKSLEKGEKSLPSYYRQESASKDKETARVEKAAVSKQEKAIAQSFPSAASPSKVSEACASSLYPSPSKSSAAYPAVTSAAFPVATSTAHPGPTAAAYSSKPSSAIPNVTSVAYPAMTSAGFSGATSAACPSKASVAYANVASAAPLGVASVTAESKNPRPSQSSVSTLDDVFLPEVLKQSSQVSQTLLNDAADEKEDSFLPDQQRFSEINTNNVVLKTGFDFLDNW